MRTLAFLILLVAFLSWDYHTDFGAVQAIWEPLSLLLQGWWNVLNGTK